MSVGKDVEKKEPSRVASGAAVVDESMEVLQNVKNKKTMDDLGLHSEILCLKLLDETGNNVIRLTYEFT